MHKKNLRNQNLLALQKLRQIIQAAQDHSNQTKSKTGISGSQIWLLQEIFDSPKMTVGELAERMSLKSTTISNLLEIVESENLISRNRDSEDRRKVLLTITNKGKSILKKAPSPTKGLLPEILSSLDADNLSQLNSGLDAILEKINTPSKDAQYKPLPFTR